MDTRPLHNDISEDAGYNSEYHYDRSNLLDTATQLAIVSCISSIQAGTGHGEIVIKLVQNQIRMISCAISYLFPEKKRAR